jgi:hypothetical protein
LLRAKRSHTRTQRDVHRIRFAVNRPRTVRSLPQMRRPRFPASAAPRRAPLRFWKRKDQLIGTHQHLTDSLR